MHYHLQILLLIYSCIERGEENNNIRYYKKQNILFSLDSQCFIPSVEHTVNTQQHVSWSHGASGRMGLGIGICRRGQH